MKQEKLTLFYQNIELRVGDFSQWPRVQVRAVDGLCFLELFSFHRACADPPLDRKKKQKPQTTKQKQKQKPNKKFLRPSVHLFSRSVTIYLWKPSSYFSKVLPR